MHAMISLLDQSIFNLVTPTEVMAGGKVGMDRCGANGFRCMHSFLSSLRRVGMLMGQGLFNRTILLALRAIHIQIADDDGKGPSGQLKAAVPPRPLPLLFSRSCCCQISQLIRPSELKLETNCSG